MTGTVASVTTPLVAVLRMTVLAGGPTVPEKPVAGGGAKFVEFEKLTGIPGRNGLLGVLFMLGGPVVAGTRGTRGQVGHALVMIMVVSLPVAVGTIGTRGQVGHGLVMIMVVLLPVAVGIGHVGHGAVAVTTVALPDF